MIEPAGSMSFLYGLALAILILVAFSLPGGYRHLVVILFVAIPVGAVALISEVFGSMIACRSMGRPWLTEVCPDHDRPVFRRSQLRWLVAPLFLLAAFLLVALDLPPRFTFWGSSGALHELAVAQQYVPGTTLVERYVSLLPVSFVQYPVSTVDGCEVSVVWLDPGFFDSAGFAYVPEALDDSIELTDGGVGWRYSGDWFLVRLE